MVSGEVFFIGVLANVDSSILSLKLDNGYEIISMSQEDGYGFLAKLEGINNQGLLAEKFWLKYRCINSQEKQIYFIRKGFGLKSFDKSLVMDSSINQWFNEFKEFTDLLGRVLRLHEEGDFFIPYIRLYALDNNNNILYPGVRLETQWHINGNLYTFDSSNLLTIQQLLKEIHFPFHDPILQLSYDNFEASYRIQYLHTQFLMAIIALETLFHPSDRDELTYRISRGIAVLLSENIEDGNSIFKDVKSLYAMRSALVHSGDAKKIKYENLSKLRDYIRKSILKLYKMDKPVKTIRDNILHVSGFGDLKDEGNC